MTKLITIDYDEYLELRMNKINFRLEVNKKLTKELEGIKRIFEREVFNKIDLMCMIERIINGINNKTNELEKEGKEND